jgi:AcrR family transcriptional regulator
MIRGPRIPALPLGVVNAKPVSFVWMRFRTVISSLEPARKGHHDSIAFLYAESTHSRALASIGNRMTATAGKLKEQTDAIPRRTRPLEKRGWILNAAASLFAERGYAKTTVGEIAAAAMVAKGLVYVHFPSKQAMLETLMKREIKAWNHAAVESALRKGGSVTEMLATASRTSIEYARDRPFLCAILAEDPRLPIRQAELEEREEPRRVVSYRASIEPLLEHGIKTGELRPDIDVSQVARVLWLIQDGLIRAIFVRRDSMANADALINESVEFVTAGLRNS